MMQRLWVCAFVILVCAGTVWGEANCYKNTTTRGVGKPIDACASGMEKDAGLCYKPCKSGFSGVGPVCWQDCPPGYTDTGAFCQPDEQWGDTSKCPLDDKCGIIYKSSKGCVKCPPGMNATGCICKTPGNIFAKESYGRGVGVPMVCSPGLDYDAGLCYPYCPSNSDGVGPVCWAYCSGNATYSCGAICTHDESQCVDTIKQLATALFDLTIQLAECIDLDPFAASSCNPSVIKQQIENIIKLLNIPMCNHSV